MTDLADPPLRSAVDKFVTPNATQSQSQVTSIWSVWFNSLATYIKSLSGGKWGATAGGTANALTIATSPVSTEYTVGRVFRFKSGSSANTGATTLNIDGIGTIAVQVNGAACSGGEIQPNQFYEVLIDTVSTCQLLLIGKTASATITTVPSKLPSIDCTQSGGALTYSMVAQYMDFRNVSLTNGTPATINCAPANLVLPLAGSTGIPTTTTGRQVLAVLNNAGTAELMVANIAGGLDMSETGLVSTTAIGSGSTANNVWYSTTARTNVAYRVIGALDVVWTTGGVGYSSPTTKINAGGEALAALSSQTYYGPLVTPVPSTVGVFTPSYTHSLGVTPSFAALEYVCLTAEQNYSIGDVIQITSAWNGSTVVPLSCIARTSTVVGGSGLCVSTYVPYITNKTTGAAATPTGADWAYRFAYRR